MLIAADHGPVRCFKLARTLFGRPTYFTAAYHVDGLIIDTGSAHTAAELDRATAELSVHTVVNTHGHEDHIGANAAIARRHGASILAHRLTLPVLADPKKEQPLRLYQKVMFGYPEPSRGRAVGDLVETERHRFQVIHTPGHSPDHIVLYEPDRGWLFAGDAFIRGRERALRAAYDIWGVIAAYKKLAELDIETLFPGSGGVRERPAQEILDKIDYLEELGHRIMALHSRGLGPAAIARKLFGRERLIAYVTLGDFSGRNMVRSYLRGGETA